VVLEEFYERQEGGLGLVLMMRSTVKDSSVVAVQIFDQKKFKRKVRTKSQRSERNWDHSFCRMIRDSSV
jgi:hypothetical protein